jgi:antitoxin MazE
MNVAKWGNSLAIRLPKAVVDALELKEGDAIDVHVVGDRSFGVRRKRSREELVQRLQSYARPFPPDFKFDRDEAHERD